MPRVKARHLGLLQSVLLLFLCQHISSADNMQSPRFVTQPSASASIVSEGRAKFLQCQAVGYPQPEYRWMKDGSFQTEFSSEPVYKIQSIRREDAGVYQCVARNAVGSIFSEQVQVLVAYMSPFNDQAETSLTIQTGDAAVLEVQALESQPKPAVTWEAEDGSPLYGHKYAIGPDNQLVILSVSESDQKLYRAHVTNTQLGQEELSGGVRLVVRGNSESDDVPARIVIAPRDTEVVRGSPVTELHCIANARSLYHLETLWFKDDEPIENSGIGHTFNDLWNRTLSLLNADPSHSGRYSCRVSTKSLRSEPVTAGANVTILEKPVLLEKVSLETLGDFGRISSLPCRARGVPTPSVKWYRNVVDVTTLPGNKYFVAEDGSLKIQKLAMEDGGMFQCVASNSAGQATAYTWLKVKKDERDSFKISNVVRLRPNDLPDRSKESGSYSPNFFASAPVMESPPENRTVRDGRDETFSCKAGGAPTPNITWIFNDTTVLVPSGRIQILEDGSLLIAAVRANDAGKYTCIRTNEAGSVEDSAFLSVLVRTQIVQPPVDTKVILGHVATMQCKVSGDSSVSYSVQWRHENKVIDPNRSQRIQVLADGTLQIAEARASDVGSYACHVTSAGGDDSRIAKLYVIELPYPPNGVAASRLGNGKMVNVSWIAGFDGNSPISKFIIQKRVVPVTGPIPDTVNSWTTEIANVSADVRWIDLPSLKAAAAYQFRVSAVNSVGEGQPSEPSNRVTLPQEAPSGPPVGLVGSARSASQIMIQWQPPEEEHRNGMITGYVVRYRLHGYGDNSPWSYRNITNENQRNYLIEDLITWKDYEIQMAAFNRIDVGKFSKSITVKTREGTPEAAPTQVRAEAVNSTTIRVWWKPPDPQLINGINQGYKLQAWRGDNQVAEKTVTVPPSPFDPLAEQTALVGGVQKYTEYQITVLCFTSPGDGPRSGHVTVKTAEDVPDEVSSLRFDEISDRSVRVSWSPPEKDNGKLTGYTVRWSVKDMPHTLKVKNVTADITSLVVNSLQPTTHYTFEVAAWTSTGIGAIRTATIQSGIEPVLPGAPTRLAVSNIEAFSVVLQFTPGFDGNSSVTKWTVQAQSLRNSTWDTIWEVADPEATTITVRNLTPFMEYALRLVANNVVGPSPPSEPTKRFQTIQAPPSHAPFNVTVRAVSATQLRVRWTPLQQIEWYGVPRGYNVSYRRSNSDTPLNAVSIEDHNANSFVLEDLEEFTIYQVIVQAYNDVGTSQPSPPATERTREATPSSGPKTVSANETSSTTIVVRWNEVDLLHRNGIIEGYKVYYGALNVPFRYKKVPSNATFTTTLTELRKFTQYSIQVLAYTRIGDGILSMPPVVVQTMEDVPGVPSNVSFPDVSFSSARVIWDVPAEPNGEILAYRVTYFIDSTQATNTSKEFAPSDRTYRVTNLEAEQFYMFHIAAKTSLGWGQAARALVYTTNSRDAPQPPSAPHVSPSQIQSQQITFSWAPGRDGFAPLRYYTVQYRGDSSGPWQTVNERVEPTVTSYTVHTLKPFTAYQFRIQAINDIGPSGWSSESEIVRTLPAAPAAGVASVKVIPITTTSVRIVWHPLSEDAWNGDAHTAAYRIDYRQITDFPTPALLQGGGQKEEIYDGKASQMILNDLVRDRNYEIIVTPFNSQGPGPSSSPTTVYVGEAVPTGEPREVAAVATTPTEVRLTWVAPLASQQNGDLLGYKIFYLATSQSIDKEEMEVVPASHVAHSLPFMDMFTEYRIQIVAFNPAGDGPRSVPVTVRTLQGIPGSPGALIFSDITMNSLKVSWEEPKQPNGEITGYVVTYETAQQDETFSKQVKQKVTTTWLVVANLEEEVTYYFSVRASTFDLGPPATGNVTTGPQEGSPGRPKDLLIARTTSSVNLQWENGPAGKGPIVGYYIESRKKEEDQWQTVARTDQGPMREYSVSYQNLMPSSSYTFRIVAYNKFGISYPVYTHDPFLTPSKLYLEYSYSTHQKPFYHQTWFLVTLAAGSVVIITLLVAVLCVKSKSYKYKHEAQKTLEESLTNEEMGFAFEMRQSKRTGTIGRNTLSRRSVAGSVGVLGGGTLGGASAGPSVVGKPPPRPAPSSVAYNSDDESARGGYDENPDDSSLTEKPSEISSTDSQGSESEPESERGEPHSFVNHYANVNDTLRQSWKKQRPVKNYTSFTDSEQEGSTVVSLNGGQIVMNNKARSRAPLPGFSSFV
ncbi:protein sidekick isoform X2 [Daphnia magna]|uniref:protein sidekick isoform X2 n=1 Tax=Daphnia magna TaxID=35525 RepID=UPI001E1BB10B|nr:protein sidekick isoform X2 [Daphnia magna]